MAPSAQALCMIASIACATTTSAAVKCAGAEVWEFGTHKAPLAAAGFHLTVWSPAVANANATVLLFVTGFGATALFGPAVGHPNPNPTPDPCRRPSEP